MLISVFVLVSMVLKLVLGACGFRKLVGRPSSRGPDQFISFYWSAPSALRKLQADPKDSLLDIDDSLASSKVGIFGIQETTAAG